MCYQVLEYHVTLQLYIEMAMRWMICQARLRVKRVSYLAMSIASEGLLVLISTIHEPLRNVDNTPPLYRLSSPRNTFVQ
jgi:hypothetical protein